MVGSILMSSLECSCKKASTETCDDLTSMFECKKIVIKIYLYFLTSIYWNRCFNLFFCDHMLTLSNHGVLHYGFGIVGKSLVNGCFAKFWPMSKAKMIEFKVTYIIQIFYLFIFQLINASSYHKGKCIENLPLNHLIDHSPIQPFRSFNAFSWHIKKCIWDFPSAIPPFNYLNQSMPFHISHEENAFAFSFHGESLIGYPRFTLSLLAFIFACSHPKP